MIAAGTYQARAVQWRMCETKGGAEQVAVECAILNDDGTDADMKITWFGFFTDKTWKRSIEALRFFGWTGNDVTDLTGLDANVVDLVIAHEEWEGKTRAKVQWVNAPGGGLALKAPLVGDKAKAFAAKMKALIQDKEKGSAPAANGKKPAAKKPSPAPSGESEDIPF